MDRWGCVIFNFEMVAHSFLEKKMFFPPNPDQHTRAQVASLLDKYGEYIQGDSDNNTKIIRDALDTHHQVRVTEGWWWFRSLFILIHAPLCAWYCVL